MRQKFDSRRVLAENLYRLLTRQEYDAHAPSPVSALRRRTGVSMGTAERVLAGNTSVGLEVIDQIARGFGLMTYQLLLPGLDPVHPMRLPASPEERRLARVVRLALEGADTEGDDVTTVNDGSDHPDRDPHGTVPRGGEGTVPTTKHKGRAKG